MISIVVDRRNWILDDLARIIDSGLKSEFGPIEILYQSDLERRPIQSLSMLRASSIVHWLEVFYLRHFAPLSGQSAHLVEVFHLAPGEGWKIALPSDTPVAGCNREMVTQLQNMGFDQVRLHRLPIDTERFQPGPQYQARHLLGLPRDVANWIGFFGKGSSNPGDRKGTALLAEVMIELNTTSSVGVVLTGEGWETYSKDLKIAGVPVHWLRSVDRNLMPSCYHALDAYICASAVEGGPMPVLEAMASGIPVISSAVGHCPEVITDGVSGYIVPRESAGYVLTIGRLLKEPLLAKEIGRNARSAVERGWSHMDYISTIRSSYLELLALSSPPTFGARERTRASIGIASAPARSYARPAYRLLRGRYS